jgi:hypothetical protein
MISEARLFEYAGPLLALNAQALARTPASASATVAIPWFFVPIGPDGIFRMTCVFIAIFASFGAFARYGQTLIVQGMLGRSSPFATLSIDVFGSFLMGFLFFETLERLNLSSELRTGILTGGLAPTPRFRLFRWSRSI